MWWRDFRKVWNLEEWGNDFEDKGRWEVGDGKKIWLWKDKWVNIESLMQKFSRLFSVSLDIGRSLSQVSEWNNNSWSWKLGWRMVLFVWKSCQTKLFLLDNKRLLLVEDECTIDKWIWRDVESKMFFVKVEYNYLKGKEFSVYWDLFAEFWKLKTLLSTQISTWRVLTNTIATKDNLLRRGITLLCDRPLCDVKEETINHLFFVCRVSWRIWELCLEWLGFLVFHYDTNAF